MWHIAINGSPVRYDELTEDQIRSYVTSGAISQNALCWNPADGGDWRPIRGTTLDAMIYKIVSPEPSAIQPPPIPTLSPRAADPPKLPPWATPNEPNKKGIGAKGIVFGIAALAILGFLFLDVKVDNSGRSSTPSASATVSTTAPRQATSVAVMPPMPSDQQNFVWAVTETKTRYASFRGNEMAQGGTRPERASRLCQMGYPRAITGWTGTLRQATTNGDGRGVLSIEIAPDIYLKTWNNALSDIGDNTLLDPNSYVFSVASGMRVGQRVRFAGTFLRGTTDCVREGSMTMDGSMRRPEFLFRFSDLASVAQ